MPMSRLAQADPDAFVAANRSPDALWLFLHIPKTAGSSLSAELNEHVPPYRNIHLSEAEYRRTDLTGRAFWAQLDRAVDSLLADEPAAHFRSASGHMLAHQAERIRAAIPRTRLVTFVRDPVSRVVSDYRYQRSAMHPAHVEFAARYPRLGDYVEAAERNKMYSHLSLFDDEPVDALIARVAATFAFVGAVELYEMSFDLLMRLVGVQAEPRHHERVGEHDEREEALDEAMEAAILARNDADAAIFRHFYSLLVRHHPGWLRARRPPVVAPEAWVSA